MTPPISRRTLLKAAATAGCILSLSDRQPAEASLGHAPAGWVQGCLSGARALVEALIAEGTLCVFGIPGAQENELWDEMKARCLPYLLVTQEQSAAMMADGCARSTGRPGVLCIVPGPGVTNALTGIGEALLDSVPLVCIVGDVAQGPKYKPFQVHELPQAALLRPVTKAVLEVKHVAEIPSAVRQAFQLAVCGEPGPVAVVVPYNLLIESYKYHNGPLPRCGLPFDADAFQHALALLSDRRVRVGIYAGLGCMDHSAELVRVAEMLQAPVATSVSGKGVINECHALAVGWGYGPQATRTAEQAFKHVDLVLAIGVRFSEVSTGFYSIPPHRFLIQVDACANNLGRIVKPTVCVHADAGAFLGHLLAHAGEVARPACPAVAAGIRASKFEEARCNAKCYARCGVDPLFFFLALRRATCPNALVFVDVAAAEHFGAEVFTTYQPRTYFNPTDNQAMGWSIPAAIGAQCVHPGRQTVAVVGDGCFLMTGMEVSTAGRASLPVKFFVLDDQAYHYMQALQKKAYRRTTATLLARLNYPALARGLGVAHVEITAGHDLEAQIRGVLATPGPVLASVVTDYGKRPIRWIEAVQKRYTRELSTEQKVRFAARLGARMLALRPQND
jgi:acetolactate synthase-1/2/3 large subunit